MNMTLARASVVALVAITVGGIDSMLRPVILQAKAPVVKPVASGGETHGGADGGAGGGSAARAEVLGLDITIPQAFALFGKSAPFVDARHREEFEAGHVQGAYLMPVEEFASGKRPAALDFLDPKQPVVVYCGGGMCDASKNVVIRLQMLGFEQCHIMTDGYPKWAEAGHPTAVGKPDVE
jgi:rhodanese-related sulfurtransferase